MCVCVCVCVCVTVATFKQGDGQRNSARPKSTSPMRQCQVKAGEVSA